jgi:hypothetical protein
LVEPPDPEPLPMLECRLGTFYGPHDVPGSEAGIVSLSAVWLDAFPALPDVLGCPSDLREDRGRKDTEDSYRSSVGAVPQQPRDAGENVAVVPEVECPKGRAFGGDLEGVAHFLSVIDLFPAWLVPGEPD